MKDTEDKIPDITNLATNTTVNTKVNEVKNETPSITNLATGFDAKINRLKIKYLILLT